MLLVHMFTAQLAIVPWTGILAMCFETTFWLAVVTLLVTCRGTDEGISQAGQLLL